MDRERAKELLPIITAFAEGKEIELKVGKDTWKRVHYPTWENNMGYRVKPKPRKFYLVVDKVGAVYRSYKEDEYSLAYRYKVDNKNFDVIEVMEVLKDGQ